MFCIPCILACHVFNNFTEWTSVCLVTLNSFTENYHNCNLLPCTFLTGGSGGMLQSSGHLNPDASCRMFDRVLSHPDCAPSASPCGRRGRCPLRPLPLDDRRRVSPALRGVVHVGRAPVSAPRDAGRLFDDTDGSRTRRINVQFVLWIHTGAGRYDTRWFQSISQ